MSLALTLAGSLALAAWLYLFFLRGWFWRFFFLPLAAPGTPPRVVAIIPARNEAEHIYDAVKSVLTQQGVALLQSIVVDDGSTDDTAAVARRAAVSCGEANRLMIVQGKPLPAGWAGKVWAMQQGAEAAQRFGADFFFFTDADIAHGERSLGALAAQAHRGCDMVSAMVELRCASSVEKLLIPAFVYFFFQLYPPKWIADPTRRTAGAAGGAILIRPAALEQAGGLAAIRGELIDDCALAARVKAAGGRLWLGPTSESRSLRGYGSFAGVGAMISRSAFNQLRHSAALLLATIVGMVLIYLAPIALLFSRQPVATALGAVATLLMLVGYIPTLRAYRRNPLWALTLPAAAVFYMGATIHSALRYWSGRGGEWKGRAQDARQ
ncbi:MAG TPA: glycosyltransferase [Terriglobales bacterium]|nr:glycosyltransferase [Terriglobales bacterium]